MKLHQQELSFSTPGRGFSNITPELEGVVNKAHVERGLLSLFIRHTSASLFINENADPDVLRDLERWMSDLVKDGDTRFRHTAEGDDDMPAHVRSVLTATSLTVPIRSGHLALGTWQAVYLWEHRHAPHRRLVDVTIVGE